MKLYVIIIIWVGQINVLLLINACNDLDSFFKKDTAHWMIVMDGCEWLQELAL